MVLLVVLFRKQIRTIAKVKALFGMPVSEFEPKYVQIGDREILVQFSKWIPQYNGSKTNFPSIRNKYGVYFIRNVFGDIVYVGFSQSNLYKALYRHFQTYNDQHAQRRIYYSDRSFYEVMIGLCEKRYAGMLEKYYINELQPIDCEFKYADLDYEPAELADPEIDFWMPEEVEVPF